MPRLKSRQEYPPGGFLFVEPGIPQWQPPPGSFNAVATAILQLRLGNPAITAQGNRSTQLSVIENELDEFNAQRCLSHGWTDFVENSAGPPSPVFLSPQRLPRPAAVGVGTSLKRAAVGVATIRDWWLGDSLKPVEVSLAEKRAQVCVECVKNGDPNLLERLTGSAATMLKGLIQAKEDMELKTSVDDKLHTCTCCGCNLGIKIWVKSDYLLKHLKPEDISALKAVVLKKDKITPMTCWIIDETGK